MDFEIDVEALIRSAVDKITSELVGGAHDRTFSDIVETTQRTVNDLGVQILERFYVEVDRLFDKQRDRKTVIIKNCAKTRRILTSMGEVSLQRKLYLDKSSSRYFFAVDEILGLKKYERIEKNLQSDLVLTATHTSYGKASELADHCVSRQTVYNLVKRVRPNEDLLSDTSAPLRAVSDIFIEADEDHIHLNTGRSAEVKLVYVHEGTRRVCKGRSELISPRYFVSVDRNPDELWKEVADYIYSTYKCSLAKIHISGDGALWIKGGRLFFPKAEYHLDKFHVFKSVTRSSFGDKKLRSSIVTALYDKDYDALRELYQREYQSRSHHSDRKILSESLAYLENNFDEIDLSPAHTCAAEGHISHVLSARLSSRPMGWSIEGAGRIAKLRAYYFNGGDFRELVSNREDPKPKLPRNMAASCRQTSDYIPRTAHVVGLDGITNGTSTRLRAILHEK